MTEFENGPVSTEIEIPRPGSLIAITKQKNGVVDIKPAVRSALKDNVTADKVTACLKKPTNNGFYHEGGLPYDKMAVADIIVDYDTRHGAAIINSKLNRKQVVDSIYVVLRHYYVLDEHGKYDGLNTKHFALLK